MKKLQDISGKAYPWGRKNVDTDIIIPAKWLKTISREGLSKGAFESVRAQEGNIFDNPLYKGAKILIAGDNFGCGSSREHAAWALADMGIEAVIAPSFSDIFSGNAFKNGLLTVELPQSAIDRLIDVAQSDNIYIDVENQMVTSEFQDRFPFEIDPFRKYCLVNGLDEIGLTMANDTEIATYEDGLDKQKSWQQPRPLAL
ncbi:3-isopropylmalate dehydratase small subunit [Sphingorhabdus lutea]|uniref:3-isopropylmalate dehydratase small subunit n=1 Tax=Sphingorhabdus lutea TaxID=1913578 RepID=A0A1L3JA17_9SPHN|nr:3-isopropylmalate dehydratase small subunit [Sphingorhabdus lutea]APG61959.1 3-isopropylmalate dehydratase small subunit [Sphingorhabdus lutea]